MNFCTNLCNHSDVFNITVIMLGTLGESDPPAVVDVALSWSVSCLSHYGVFGFVSRVNFLLYAGRCCCCP